MRNSVAILTIAISIAALSWAAPAQAAKACALKSIVGAPKTGTDKKAAGAKARRDWKNRVAASRGPIWSNWGVASDRSVKCKSKGSAVQCRARAMPCKELGSFDKESGGTQFKLVR
jgi:hypothetical protein